MHIQLILLFIHNLHPTAFIDVSITVCWSTVQGSCEAQGSAHNTVNSINKKVFTNQTVKQLVINLSSWWWMPYCCRFLSSCHFIKYKLELPSLSSWGCQTSVFFHQNHGVFMIMHHHSLQAAHTLERTTLSCHYLCISLFKLELWLKTVQNPQTDCLFKLVNALELGHYPSLVIIIIIHIPLVHTPS